MWTVTTVLHKILFFLNKRHHFFYLVSLLFFWLCFFLRIFFFTWVIKVMNPKFELLCFVTNDYASIWLWVFLSSECFKKWLFSEELKIIASICKLSFYFWEVVVSFRNCCFIRKLLFPYGKNGNHRLNMDMYINVFAEQMRFHRKSRPWSISIFTIVQ